MIYEAIIHEQTRDYIYPINKNQLAIRIRTKRGDIKKCFLNYWNRQKSHISNRIQVEMVCYSRDKRFDYYEVVIDTVETSKYIKYFFEIKDENETIWLHYYGICHSIPDERVFEYLYTNDRDYLVIPNWVKNSVFYQIFPERFYDGDINNNPDNAVVWESEPNRVNFMGGDIKGIYDKVEYLKDLGINAIYLNPIFESPSNHKYDTVDYLQVDNHFGTKNDLKKLVDILHRNNIRIILDGVFNHCGYFMAQFQDVLQKGKESIYNEWFYIDSYPIDTEIVNYECVGYYKWMPKLRVSHPEVKAYILKIAKYWIEEIDIDGWRLDVADEVDNTLWYQFREVVKSVKPECFILAETWRENRSMLRGDQMDSVMNYLFYYAVIDFFAKNSIDSFEFDARINQFLGIYPKQSHYTLFNLIGSHDTIRFLTACGGNKSKLKLAVAFQICFIGIPSIYYGDEIGMQGENDPGCRGAMDWKRIEKEQDLLKWYKQLIHIRKSKKALVEGVFKTIYCNDKDSVYAFVRETSDECVYIVLNNGEIMENIILPTIETSKHISYLKDLITGEKIMIGKPSEEPCYNDDIYSYTGSIALSIGSYEVKILSKQNKDQV
jgi:glycosidase